MEFTVTRSDLLKELTLISGIVEKKTTVPVLSHVLLQAAVVSEGSEEKVTVERLQISGTDLMVGLTTSCPISITEPGDIVVNAKRLQEIVNAVPDKPIKFKTGASGWVSITCGTSRFRVAAMEREDFPQLPTVSQCDWSIPSGTLAEAIRLILFAISQDSSKYVLDAGLLVLGGVTLTAVATDGHRLSLVQNSGKAYAKDAKELIGRKALSETLKLIANSHAEEVGLAVDENHQFFVVGNRVLMTRKPTGTFPNYEAVMPTNPYEAVVPIAELTAAVNRAAIMADEKTRSIRLLFETNKLTVSSADSAAGEADETIEIQYNGPEQRIGMNSAYVADFLGAVKDPSVTVKLKNADSAVEFTVSVDLREARYVVMPMRI